MEGGSKSSACTKRLMSDLKRMKDDSPAGVSGAPREDNLMVWDAIISGFDQVGDSPVPIMVRRPPETPWDGGLLKLTLEFKQDYPMTPPKVRFVSNMFHPNVYNHGGICLDILNNMWSPAYGVATILTSIQSLLCDPNTNSPANPEAARLYCGDREEYNKRVGQVVLESLSNIQQKN